MSSRSPLLQKFMGSTFNHFNNIVFLFKMVGTVGLYGEDTHQVPNVNDRTWEMYNYALCLLMGTKTCDCNY